ncbi:hypothetical protein [Paenibacillus sp. GP183]|uniref:hypothetical protein n=1 Tax=Paenibacillus sp. GP183 TaxID=1882751 RepID=UPI00089BA64C|nr:hypothetical protein [Paenibacillus sp. GP183]SEB45646.1 hypothetical protein SAMN05443246_0450 [Paenibacillus sp. GP183]
MKIIALLLVMAAFVAEIFTDHEVGVKAATPTVDTYDNIINAYKAHQQANGESDIDTVIQDSSKAKSKTFYIHGIDSVVSAQLIPAHAGMNSTILKLDLQKSKDREVIAKVLKWLGSSKVVGDAKDQFISFGSNLTSLTFKFKSGDIISIEDAIGTSSPIKFDDGNTQIHSTNIQNQVTVYQNNKARRIVAPELKAWIENGWQSEESFAFTPEEAVAKVLKEHPEFPAAANDGYWWCSRS